jgi:hypothetical protein
MHQEITNKNLTKSIVEVALEFVRVSQNRSDSKVEVFGSSTSVKGQVYDFLQILDHVSIFNKQTQGEIIYDYQTGKVIKNEGMTKADLDNWREALNLVVSS